MKEPATTTGAFESRVATPPTLPPTQDPALTGSTHDALPPSPVEQLGMPPPYVGEQPGVEDEAPDPLSSPERIGRAETNTDEGMGAGVDTTVARSERELCDALTQGAKLRSEDIQGGVALIATPRGAADLAEVTARVRSIEHALAPAADRTSEPGATPGSPTAGERCPLFTFGRMAGRREVIEEAATVRILFKSDDPVTVAALRRDARAYLGSLGKGSR
jgi:hypothetical protein